MKKFFSITVLCVCLLSCQKMVVEKELPSHNTAARPLNKENIWQEDYNVVIFDSCRNEEVSLSGVAVYKLEEVTTDSYYIRYEIDLEGVTGIGAITKTEYKGGGKIIGEVKASATDDVRAKTTYKVKYHGDNGAQISFTQNARFKVVNGQIKVEFNNINDTCK